MLPMTAAENARLLVSLCGLPETMLMRKMMATAASTVM